MEDKRGGVSWRSGGDLSVAVRDWELPQGDRQSGWQLLNVARIMPSDTGTRESRETGLPALGTHMVKGRLPRLLPPCQDFEGWTGSLLWVQTPLHPHRTHNQSLSPLVLKPCHSYIMAIHQTGKTDSEGQARTCHLGVGFRVWGQISKPVSLVLGKKNCQGLSSAAVARAWGKNPARPIPLLNNRGSVPLQLHQMKVRTRGPDRGSLPHESRNTYRTEYCREIQAYNVLTDVNKLNLKPSALYYQTQYHIL